MTVTHTEIAVDRRAALQGSRLEQLARMVEIRLVEETVQTLYNDGHIRGSTHLANGQEAVSVGIATVARPTDTVACTYRGHGTALALGVTPEGVLGEICGRSIGCIGGMGGSMHLGDMSVGLLPTFAIVGAGVPVAAGAALTAWVRGTDDAAIAIFGDGATNIGAFHEGLNLAGILKLPVVFVCENNLYGEYSRINLTTPVEHLADRAAAYGMPGVAVDGQDVDEVIAAVEYGTRSGPRRRGSDPAGDEDLPLLRTLAVRRRCVPARRRARRVEAARPDRHLPGQVARCRGGDGRATRRTRRADRPTGQVRRGGSAGEPAAGGRRDVSPRHGHGPLMRHTLTIPKLGDSVSEVVILEWHVAVGDTVGVGDPLVSVETDKIDADVPSTVAGTVVELLVEPTDEVATGAPFVVVDES